MPAGAPSFHELLAERWTSHTNPPPDNTFERLGYAPICKARVLAQQSGEKVLPEPCGQCPQELFHSATEFDVLYGGAAGGGKTKALLMEGIRACVLHPRVRVGAFRRTYDELAESFIKELIFIDYARELGARWNGTDHQLTFPNGSVIRFRYLESVSDATRRQGGEYQLVLFDELTMMPPEAIDIVAIERLRAGPGVPVLGIRSASNPGDIGHGAAKTRYVEGTNYGERTYTDDFGRTVRFIPAKVSDNPHLDEGYINRLYAIPDPARRAAMLDGSWDTFAGQVFAEWSHDRHVVPAFTVPATWQRYAGIDWGYAAPHAVVWGAFNDGRLWVYRERYGTETAERDLARLILEDEGAYVADGLLARRPPEHVRVRAADPSMWNKVADAAPIAETFILAGCAVVKATNDRLGGVQRVHSFLGDGPACAIHRKLGWETCPLLHVMDCAPNLIRTLPALPYDAHRPEDVDTDAEDHAYDALRYLLMQLPVPRVGREARSEPESHQERIAEQLRERVQRRHRGGYVGAF